MPFATSSVLVPVSDARSPSSVRSLLVGGPRIQKISDLQRTTAIEIATGWDGGFREAFVERNHFLSFSTLQG